MNKYFMRMWERNDALTHGEIVNLCNLMIFLWDWELPSWLIQWANLEFAVHGKDSHVMLPG